MSTNKSFSSETSERYSRALFEVANETKELDKIAYIRFASVYTNFKEVGEFGEYIEELDGKSKE